MAFWLATKLNESCVCGSGKSYRLCCLFREIVYLLIAALVAAALFLGAGGMDAGVYIRVMLAVLTVAGVLGWLVCRWLK